MAQEKRSAHKLRNPSEKLLATDRYGNEILLIKNQGDGFDLMTDGRVFLDVRLAKALAKKLLEFAAKQSQ